MVLQWSNQRPGDSFDIYIYTVYCIYPINPTVIGVMFANFAAIQILQKYYPHLLAEVRHHVDGHLTECNSAKQLPGYP